MAEVGKLSVRLVADGSQLGQDIEGEVDKAGKSGPAKAAAMKWGGRLGKAVIAGGIAAGVKGVMDFSNFEKGMAEVFTLLPDASAESMAKMTEDVKDFAKEFGVLPKDTIPALYQAISAGVPQDNVFSFLETAQQAAKGGVTDLETAVDGISSVVNAYGSDVISATEASDLMFTAVKLGKTNFEELSRSLFQVTPVASALGVDFGDVTAGLASLTAMGVPTSVATTQMRQMFVELSKEGGKTSEIFQEISGKSFKDFIAEGGNTADALDLLSQFAEEAGIGVNDLFGSVEAGSAALALSKNDSEAFRGALDEMGNAAGATSTAFDTMENTMSSDMEKLKVSVALLVLELGDKLAPAFSKIVDIASKVIGFFSELPGPVQTAIVGIVGLGAALLAFAGPILKVIQLVKLLKLGFLANPWMLLIVGIIIVVGLIIKYWDEIMAAVKVALEWIGNAISVAWNFVKDLTVTVFNAVKDFFVKYWPIIIAILTGPIGIIVLLFVKNFDKIKKFVIRIFEAIRDFFIGIFDKIKEIFTGVVDFVTELWDRAFNAVKDTVVGIFEGLRDLISGIIDGIKSIFQGLVDKGSEIVGFFSELPGKIGGFFLDMKDRVKNRIDDVKGFFQGLWDKMNEVIGFFRGMPGTIGGFFVDLFDRIRENVNKILGFISTLKEKAIDALGPVGKVIEFGSKIIGGVAGAAGSIVSGVGSIFRADGGPAMMGRPYIVGEQGPELIVPSRSGTVIPADATAGMLSGGGGLVIQGPLIGNAQITSPEDITRLSRELARDIDRRQRATGNRLGATV
jgi:TP901 family phage tail tape measure protein